MTAMIAASGLKGCGPIPQKPLHTVAFSRRTQGFFVEPNPMANLRFQETYHLTFCVGYRRYSLYDWDKS